MKAERNSNSEKAAFRLAIELMKETGCDLIKKQRQVRRVKLAYKKGKEIISSYDVSTEKKIRKLIRKIFPQYKLWGEELGAESGNLSSEDFIVIDPIDGTKNFLSGVPLFASQIACIKKGKIAWGIINLPALNEIFWAIKGKGAFLNGKKISPSKQTSLDLAMQCFGIGHDANNFLKLPRLINDHLAEPRHYGCAGVHYSFVACGRTDIYIAKEHAFYDLAAGTLLCQEAGLSMCQLNGRPYNIDKKGLGLVIANKVLLKSFQKVIKNKQPHSRPR
jgi:myo-inositol-1(or 4)-monophosphatase